MIRLSSITKGFRRFAKKQFLTEAHLNQVVDYFDDQIRLSRTCLSGAGIVCGFEVSCNRSQTWIEITQGLGVSTDGDLFHIYKTLEGTDEKIIDYEIEPCRFTHYRLYDNKEVEYKPYFYDGDSQYSDIYELLPEAGNSEVFPLSTFGGRQGFAVKDAVILLYLETFEQGAPVCSSMGCDNDGNEIISNYKVLLTSKATAEKINQHDAMIRRTNFAKLYYKLPEVTVPRVVIQPEDFESYITLVQRYVKPIKQYKIQEKLEDGFTLLFTALEAPDLLAKVANILNSLFPAEGVFLTGDIQYRYDVLKDVTDTYNEIKSLLRHMATTDCCPEVTAFPKHLMLGEVNRERLIDVGDTKALRLEKYNCYECRHGFYPSVAHSDQSLNICDSCGADALDFDFEPGAVTTFCEGSLDVDGNHAHHIVFIIDESGSFRGQIQFVKNALNVYLTTIKDSNTYISIIGMSQAVDNNRSDHVIYKRSTDPAVTKWINEIYGTSASQGNGGVDYWGSGYQVVIDEILNTEVPNPSIVINLGDEAPAPYNNIVHKVTAERADLIKKTTKLFVYIVDNFRRDGVLSGYVLPALGDEVKPSINGASDLDTTDYFLATDFSDLELKIKNLNEALINSNILCTVDTVTEIDKVEDSNELAVCYNDINDDVQYLNSLLKRAVLQLTNYNSRYNLVKITPSRALGELSKKAIPFYYNVGEELIANWNYEKTVMGRHKTNFSYHSNLLDIKKPLELCIEKDFYRIEGHQGRDYREVVDRLRSIREEFKLEFNIVVLEMQDRPIGVPSSPSEREERLIEEEARFVEGGILGTDPFTIEYLKKNSGLEHKAGVAPKGTFVIVYLKSSLILVEPPSEEREVLEGGDIALDTISTRFEGSEFYREFNPVIADFTIPHLCCDEKYVSGALRDTVFCIDRAADEPLVVPFDINPKDGVVKAIVPRGYNGGVVRDEDGLYSFVPKNVSEDLHGIPISFEVNNQPIGFSVKVYKKPELVITATVKYNKLKTEATVTYKVVGEDFEKLDFSWDFGDRNLSNVKPDSKGLVKKKYKLPVNETNTIQQTLKVSYDMDACPTMIPIKPIKFDDPIVISLTFETENICLDKSSTEIISVGYTVSPAGETIVLKKNIAGISITPTTVDFDPAVFATFNKKIAFTVLDEDTTATITVTRKPELVITVDPSKIIYNADKSKVTVTFKIAGEGLPASPAFEWSFGDGTMLTASSLTQVYEYTDLELLTDRRATVMVLLPGTICDDTSATIDIQFEAPPVPVVFTIQPSLCLDKSGTTLIEVPYTITPEGTVLELSTTVVGVTVLPGVLEIDPATFVDFDTAIEFKSGTETLDQKITITRKPEFQINFDPESILYTETFFTATVFFEVTGTYIPPGAELEWDFGDGELLNRTELKLQHVYVNLGGFPDRTVQAKVSITDSVCGTTTATTTITFKAPPVPVELKLERNEVCLDTSNCIKPVHIAITAETSLAIDEIEAEDIRKALSSFVSGQQNTERLLTYLSMEVTRIRDIDKSLVFNRYITALTRKTFLDSIAVYPDRRGRFTEGTSDWRSFFKIISESLGSVKPNFVVVVTEGLQTSSFINLRQNIKTLNDQGTHVFYFAVSTGAYVTEAEDGSIVPAEPGSNNLVKTLTQLMGREPVLASPDFSDVETADYYTPKDFKDLSRFLNRLNKLTPKEGDCSPRSEGGFLSDGGGLELLAARSAVVTERLGENSISIPITVSPESAIVKTTIDYEGVEVSGNTILIDPKEFKAFDESIAFTVNAQAVPETLIVHEEPHFGFNFIDIVEFDQDQGYIPDGAIITQGEVIGNGSFFQSTTVVCNAFNLNNFDESEYSFLWDFGDGTTSKERNPVHRYRYAISTDIVITLKVVGGFCESEISGSFFAGIFT